VELRPVTLYQDGLYRMKNGQLEKVEIDDFGMKKILVAPEGFEAAVSVQKRMRKVLKGNKPDIGLVAEAMLLAAAELPDLEEKVRLHALHVFSGSNS
jgi:hypothetical protein